jgi:hypothetical protein
MLAFLILLVVDLVVMGLLVAMPLVVVVAALDVVRRRCGGGVGDRSISKR